MSGILARCLPVTTGASHWGRGRLLGHDAMLVLGLAVLAGLLARLASAEAQHAIETRVRRRIGTAKFGSRRTLAGAW